MRMAAAPSACTCGVRACAGLRRPCRSRPPRTAGAQMREADAGRGTREGAAARAAHLEGPFPSVRACVSLPQGQQNACTPSRSPAPPPVAHAPGAGGGSQMRPRRTPLDTRTPVLPCAAEGPHVKSRLLTLEAIEHSQMSCVHRGGAVGCRISGSLAPGRRMPSRSSAWTGKGSARTRWIMWCG